MDVYIGIDVACAKGKYLPLVICHHQNQALVPLPLSCYPARPPKGLGNVATLSAPINLAFAEDVASYIEVVCSGYGLQPKCIGIDSPLRPRANNLKRRLAEQALDRAGIHCYTTPSEADFEVIRAKGLAHTSAGNPAQNLPHSMQIFMLLGFALYERLKHIAPCIEVYPHATAKLLNAAGLHKSKQHQPQQQLAAISQYTAWPATEQDRQSAETMCFGPMHDKVDAYSAAWVASLPEHQRDYFGDPTQDDAIWVPKLVEKPIPPQPLKHSPNTQPKTTEHQRVCPACGLHTFKRWPFGWDAHAAYKCSGLKETGPEKRKAEYKRRFMQ